MPAQPRAALFGAAFLLSLASDSGAGRDLQRPLPARIPDARAAALAAVSECGASRSQTGKSRCYERAFLNRLESVGVRDALAVLQRAAEADPEVARDGHVYAHGIGIEAYRLWPVVAERFPECTTGFASGCYHGVIQAHLSGIPKAGTEELLALCAPFRGADTPRWLLFQCLHGAGHGLLMYYRHELPEALAACDLFGEAWDRESCYGGVFMENIMHATAPHHPATRLAAHSRSSWRPLEPEDPLYPCSAMRPIYQRACYRVQTSAILERNGGDLAAAARECDRAPLQLRRACYESLGRDVSAYADRDPARAIELCAVATPAFRPACYFGAAKSLVDWAATPAPGFRMCRWLAGDPSKHACYVAVGEQIAALFPDPGARVAACAGAESGFSAVCGEAARRGP